MLPGLSIFTPEERQQEFEAMRASPKFNLKVCLDFAENGWVFPVYPYTYDNYLKEMDNWADPCPLTDVKCPTHISHGTKDADPLASAHRSHEGIAGSELRIIEGAWHLMDFHPEADDLWAEQVAFAKKHTPGMGAAVTIN